MKNRVCCICAQEKPLTEEFFSFDTRNGRQTFWVRCRVCVSVKRRRNSALAKDGFKTCNKCDETKPISEFHYREQSKDKLSYSCKSCERCRAVEKYHTKSSENIKRRNQIIKLKRYNMSPEDYQTLLEKQNNKCAICESTDPKNVTSVFNVDHCHITGRVRGLLCFSCNTALGNFQDSKTILQKAINYLTA